jgi:hypothetical protein
LQPFKSVEKRKENPKPLFSFLKNGVVIVMCEKELKREKEK